MRRLAVAALVFAGIAGSACAQRGATRGAGFAARPAVAMHGGQMNSGARSFSAPSSFAGNRSIGITSSRPAVSQSRRGYPGENRYRRPYGGYGVGIPYVVPIWSGWADPGTLNYGDTNDYGANGYADPGVVAAYPDGYTPGQPDPGQTPPGPYAIPYQPLPPPVAALPQQPLADEEPVTLVFRDGRPSQQIHNYALTRTTLVIMDGRRREIPLAQLDLAETERVNREAGVEFKPLDASR